MISVIEGRVGVDGLTHLLRSTLNIAAGRNAEAVENMRAAIRAEPDYFDAHFTLAMKLVEMEQFGEAIKVFGTLAEGFGWELSASEFAEEIEFRKFVTSPEYQAWKR